jgi:hypothetical protein
MHMNKTTVFEADLNPDIHVHDTHSGDPDGM